MVVAVWVVVREESVGVRDSFRVIDGDGHMMEPMDIWDSYVEGSFRERAPKVVGHRSKTRHVYGPCEIFPEGAGDRGPQRPTHFEADFPERFGEAYESYWSLSSRLKHMDEEGTDIMVGFPTTGGVATSEAVKDPALQAALCRAYNNWGVDYCARLGWAGQVHRDHLGERSRRGGSGGGAPGWSSRGGGGGVAGHPCAGPPVLCAGVRSVVGGFLFGGVRGVFSWG